jgi:hypothetical protein
MDLFSSKINQSECAEHFGGSTDAVRGTVDKAVLEVCLVRISSLRMGAVKY